ncbi:methylthioribose kinase [Bacillus sp. BGMRC 2118]|nr:methylthioribose kinase [Bacillus sp. BGMRC 2118]
MVQRFIELGEGYSDIYELIEIGKTNKHRIRALIELHTTKGERSVTSVAIALHPTAVGDFLPIYICKEGIPLSPEKPSGRLALFQQLSAELDKPINRFEVKNSNSFADDDLFYQYLTGILRLYHVIPHI